MLESVRNMSINDLFDSEWIIPLIIIFCLGFFIFIPVYISKTEKKTYGGDDVSVEKREARATIVDKSTETNLFTQNGVVNHVVFEFEDGNRVSLAVKDAQTMVVGDNGILSYQGKRFVSFIRG